MTLAEKANGRRSEVVSLADGSTLGKMDVRLGKYDQVRYWHDVVLATQGDRLVRSIAGRTAPVEGADEVSDGSFLFEVHDGAVGLTTRDRSYGIDLEAGTLAPVDADSSTLDFDTARTLDLQDGDEVLITDLGTGRVLARRDIDDDDVKIAAGPGGVLIQEDAGWLRSWRHWTSPNHGRRFVLLGRDGERHGTFYADRTEVIDAAVLGGHEAVVLTRSGSDDDGSDRVVLIGR